MIALGIDPAMTTTGLALVGYDEGRFTLDWSCDVHTPDNLSDAERLSILASAIRDALRLHTGIEVVGMETPFVGKWKDTALALGAVQGVTRLVVFEHDANLPAHRFAPASIKKGLSGSGAASKLTMIEMVRVVTGRYPTSEHIADATGAAVCAILRLDAEKGGTANVLAGRRGRKGARVGMPDIGYRAPDAR